MENKMYFFNLKTNNPAVNILSYVGKITENNNIGCILPTYNTPIIYLSVDNEILLKERVLGSLGFYPFGLKGFLVYIFFMV